MPSCKEKKSALFDFRKNALLNSALFGKSFVPNMEKRPDLAFRVGEMCL